MIGKKGVIVYVTVLVVALAAVLFGAYTFFLGGVKSDDCVKNMMDNQTASEPEDTDIRQHAIPSEETNAQGQTIDGAWYYVYDLEAAGEEIRSFLGI